MLNAKQRTLIQQFIAQELQRADLQVEETLAWLANENDGQKVSEDMASVLALLKVILTEETSIETSTLLKMLKMHTLSTEQDPTYTEVKTAMMDVVTSTLLNPKQDELSRYRGAYLSITPLHSPYPQLVLEFATNAPEFPSIFMRISTTLNDILPVKMSVNAQGIELEIDLLPDLKISNLIAILSRLPLDRAYVSPEKSFIQAMLGYQKYYQVDFQNAKTPCERFQKHCEHLFLKWEEAPSQECAMMCITTATHELFKKGNEISVNDMKALSSFWVGIDLPEDIKACLKAVVFNKMGHYLRDMKAFILAKSFFTRANIKNDNEITSRLLLTLLIDNHRQLIELNPSDSPIAMESKAEVAKREAHLESLTPKSNGLKRHVFICLPETMPAAAEGQQEIAQPFRPEQPLMRFRNYKAKTLEEMTKSQREVIKRLFGFTETELKVMNKFEQAFVDYSGIQAPQQGHANMKVIKGRDGHSFETILDLRLNQEQKVQLEAFCHKANSGFANVSTQLSPVGWNACGIYRFRFDAEAFTRYLHEVKAELDAKAITANKLSGIQERNTI